MKFEKKSLMKRDGDSLRMGQIRREVSTVERVWLGKSRWVCAGNYFEMN